MGGASDPAEWLKKADLDVQSAQRLLADPALIETASYHTQQAAEKALKAF